jgi:AmiR/NasT family two-component response regulator
VPEHAQQKCIQNAHRTLWTIVCTENLNPDIVVMKSAKD